MSGAGEASAQQSFLGRGIYTRAHIHTQAHTEAHTQGRVMYTHTHFNLYKLPKPQIY